MVVGQSLFATAAVGEPLPTAQHWVVQPACVLANAEGAAAAMVALAMWALPTTVLSSQGDAAVAVGVTHFHTMMMNYWGGLFHGFEQGPFHAPTTMWSSISGRRGTMRGERPDTNARP